MNQPRITGNHDTNKLGPITSELGGTLCKHKVLNASTHGHSDHVMAVEFFSLVEEIVNKCRGFLSRLHSHVPGE